MPAVREGARRWLCGNLLRAEPAPSRGLAENDQALLHQAVLPSKQTTGPAVFASPRS